MLFSRGEIFGKNRAKMEYKGYYCYRKHHQSALLSDRQEERSNHQECIPRAFLIFAIAHDFYVSVCQKQPHKITKGLLLGLLFAMLNTWRINYVR